MGHNDVLKRAREGARTLCVCVSVCLYVKISGSKGATAAATPPDQLNRSPKYKIATIMACVAAISRVG